MINTRKLLLGSAGFIFVWIECLLFYLIHFERADFGFNLHYTTIVAATLFSWLVLIVEIATAKENGEDPRKILLSKSQGNFIRIAMLFTLFADYFLVAAKEINNLAGVSTFIGTQVFICLHIICNEKNKKWQTANLIVRAVLSVITVTVALIVLGEDADALAIVSMIYYANLITNAIFAHRIGKSGIMLTIGLVLFALCDINVGLSGLDMLYGGFPEGSLLYNIMNSDVDLIWLFYIPSQTLIPLTLLFIKNKNSQYKKEQI